MTQKSRDLVIQSLEVEERRFKFFLSATVAPLGIIFLQLETIGEIVFFGKLLISIAVFSLLFGAAAFLLLMSLAHKEIISVYHYTNQEKIEKSHDEFEDEVRKIVVFALVSGFLGYALLVLSLVTVVWL